MWSDDVYIVTLPCTRNKRSLGIPRQTSACVNSGYQALLCRPRILATPTESLWTRLHRKAARIREQIKLKNSIYLTAILAARQLAAQRTRKCVDNNKNIFDEYRYNAAKNRGAASPATFRRPRSHMVLGIALLSKGLKSIGIWLLKSKGLFLTLKNVEI